MGNGDSVWKTAAGVGIGIVAASMLMWLLTARWNERRVKEFNDRMLAEVERAEMGYRESGWRVDVTENPLTDEVSVDASLRPEEGGPTSRKIRFECVEGELIGTIGTGFVIPAEEPAPVLVRWDSGPPVSHAWSHERGVYQLPNPKLLLKTLVMHETLALGFDFRGEPQALRFELDGSRQALGPLQECIGEPKGPAPSPARLADARVALDAGAVGEARRILDELRLLPDPPPEYYDLLNQVSEAESKAAIEAARRFREEDRVAPPVETEAERQERLAAMVQASAGGSRPEPQEIDPARDQNERAAQRLRVAQQMTVWWKDYETKLRPFLAQRARFAKDWPVTRNKDEGVLPYLDQMERALLQFGQTLPEPPDPLVARSLQGMYAGYLESIRHARKGQWVSSATSDAEAESHRRILARRQSS